MRRICLVLLCLPLVATAQESDEELSDYARSRVHFEAGEFEEAIELLLQVYEEQPEAVLLYNVARTYEAWAGHPEEARDYYQRFLEAEPESPNRRAVEGRIEALTEAIEGDADRERLEEERIAALAAAEEEERRRRRAEAKPSPLPWVVLGLGVAAGGAGAIVGARARSEENAAESARTGIEAGNANQRSSRLALGANVTFAAAGALALTGLIWGIINVRRSRRVQADIGFGTASLRLNF